MITHFPANLSNSVSSEFQNDQQIITDWLLSKSYGSRESYFGIIKRIYGYSNNTPLQQWTKQMLLSFLRERHLTSKTTTVNKNLACIRSLLNHCVKENYLSRNVAANISKFREHKLDRTSQTLQVTERIIGHSQVWSLIENTSTQKEYTLLKTIYLLGLRANEACNLHWQDITPEFNNYKIKIIGKGNRIDFMIVHQKLYLEWVELGTTEFIFNISKPTIHRIVKKAAHVAGLNPLISTHWLRHQRASDLANSNKFTLFQVMEFMRHSSPTITAKYVHTDSKIGSDALL